jgi:hypothetical protein
MTNQSIKLILLEALIAAERMLEKDLKQDVESKKSIQYLLYFFKSVGIDTLEKLALKSRAYIKEQVQIGIDRSVAKVSLVVSVLINLIIGFLIISIGLVFGAVGLSLFIGELLGSDALGFIISGFLWVLVMLSTLKMFFNKKKIEHFISRKIKPN